MKAQKNKVIIVNSKDEWMGTMDKMEAHKTGTLHRAFSVFILNSKNELLLQKRAADKYHSGGLWSNTCCSHPYPGESTKSAATRRLKEELGFDAELDQIYTQEYSSAMDNGLIENEYDHIYLGYSDITDFNLNLVEVSETMYISIDKLLQWMKDEPKSFTAWLHIVMPKFLQHIGYNRSAA